MDDVSITLETMPHCRWQELLFYWVINMPQNIVIFLKRVIIYPCTKIILFVSRSTLFLQQNIVFPAQADYSGFFSC